jgi:hypothetical protein
MRSMFMTSGVEKCLLHPTFRVIVDFGINGFLDHSAALTLDIAVLYVLRILCVSRLWLRIACSAATKRLSKSNSFWRCTIASAVLCQNKLSIWSWSIFASTSIIIFITSSVSLSSSSPNIYDTEGSGISLIEEVWDVGLEKKSDEGTDFWNYSQQRWDFVQMSTISYHWHFLSWKMFCEGFTLCFDKNW